MQNTVQLGADFQKSDSTQQPQEQIAGDGILATRVYGRSSFILGLSKSGRTVQKRKVDGGE